MDEGDNSSNQEANWQYKSGADPEEQLAGSELGQSPAPANSNLPSVQWSASEYVEHEKDSMWYLLLFAGGITLTAFIYLVTRDILASSVVLLAVISIGIFAKRKPETKNYSVDDKGLQIGDKKYNYSQFRSFSVVEEGAIDSIWLKPLKRFAPAVIIYFAPEDEEKIIEVLSNFLPHEDRKLDPIDRFSKRVRF